MRYLAMTTWIFLLGIQSAYGKPAGASASSEEYVQRVQRIRQLEGEDRAAALAEVERALARFPVHIGFHLKRCGLLLDLGRSQPALLCLDEAAQRLPGQDADWEKVWSRLQQRASRLEQSKKQDVELSPVQAAVPPARDTGTGAHVRRFGRKGWIWVAAGLGAAATGLGLILGMVPRPHERVEWQP